MKLFLADYHLEAASVCLAQGKESEAEELIEEMEYFRRKEEARRIKSEIGKK